MYVRNKTFHSTNVYHHEHLSLLKEIWCVCMQQIQEASLKKLEMNHFLDPFTKTAPLDTEQHWQQAHMEGTHRPDCCFTGTLLYFSVTRGGVALVNLLNILDYKINRLGHQEKSLRISRSLWSNQAGGKWQLPWLRWDAQGATRDGDLLVTYEHHQSWSSICAGYFGSWSQPKYVAACQFIDRNAQYSFEDFLRPSWKPTWRTNHFGARQNALQVKKWQTAWKSLMKL